MATMIESQFSTQSRLIREAMHATKRENRAARDEALDDALVAFDGIHPTEMKTDLDILRAALVKRFGVAIQEGKDGGFDIYVRGDFVEAMDNGMLETVVVRLYRMIVEAQATLFTQDDQKWEFSDAGAKKVVPELRKAGNCGLSLVRGNRLGVALGSAAVRPIYRSRKLIYEAIPPQCLYAGFGRAIDDDGTARAVDTSDIEDASVIVARMPDDTSDEAIRIGSAFVAYFGRSQGYPAGRCVEYRAREWYQIPEFGHPDAIDHIVNGEPANPLTALQNEHGVEKVPFEYPLIVLRGSDAGTGVFPTDGLSLYQVCTEIDISWTRCLRSAVSAAVGTQVLERTSDSAGSALPSSVEGPVALSPGQKLTFTGRDAARVVSAVEVVKSLQRMVAESRSVPGFMVAAEPTAPESGYAIALRSQPLLKKRGEQIEINRTAVDRLFQIERCLLWAGTGKEPWPSTAVQTWDAGSWQPPRNEKEELENIKLAMDATIMDRVEAVKRFYNLETDKDAQKKIDEMEKRKAAPARRKPPPIPGQPGQPQVPGGEPGAKPGTEQPPKLPNKQPPPVGG